MDLFFWLMLALHAFVIFKVIAWYVKRRESSAIEAHAYKHASKLHGQKAASEPKP